MYIINIYYNVLGSLEFFDSTNPISESELDETLRIFRKPSMFGSKQFKLEVRKV